MTWNFIKTVTIKQADVIDWRQLDKHPGRTGVIETFMSALRDVVAKHTRYSESRLNEKAQDYVNYDFAKSPMFKNIEAAAGVVVDYALQGGMTNAQLNSMREGMEPIVESVRSDISLALDLQEQPGWTAEALTAMVKSEPEKAVNVLAQWLPAYAHDNLPQTARNEIAKIMDNVAAVQEAFQAAGKDPAAIDQQGLHTSIAALDALSFFKPETHMLLSVEDVLAGFEYAFLKLAPTNAVPVPGDMTILDLANHIGHNREFTPSKGSDQKTVQKVVKLAEGYADVVIDPADPTSTILPQRVGEQIAAELSKAEWLVNIINERKQRRYLGRDKIAMAQRELAYLGTDALINRVAEEWPLLEVVPDARAHYKFVFLLAKTMDLPEMMAQAQQANLGVELSPEQVLKSAMGKFLELTKGDEAAYVQLDPATINKAKDLFCLDLGDRAGTEEYKESILKAMSLYVDENAGPFAVKLFDELGAVKPLKKNRKPELPAAEEPKTLSREEERLEALKTPFTAYTYAKDREGFADDTFKAVALTSLLQDYLDNVTDIPPSITDYLQGKQAEMQPPYVDYAASFFSKQDAVSKPVPPPNRVVSEDSVEPQPPATEPAPEAQATPSETPEAPAPVPTKDKISEEVKEKPALPKKEENPEDKPNEPTSEDTDMKKDSAKIDKHAEHDKTGGIWEVDTESNSLRRKKMISNAMSGKAAVPYTVGDSVLFATMDSVSEGTLLEIKEATVIVQYGKKTLELMHDQVFDKPEDGQTF